VEGPVKEKGVTMHRIVRKPSLTAVGLAAVVIVAGGIAAATAAASGKDDGRYTVHSLVSDQAGKADTTDPNLVNAWGIAASSTSPWWINDNGKDVSTLYNGDGVPQPAGTPLVVSVDGGPTGIVFNGSPGFVVDDGNGHSGPSVFMFATEDGTIRGWNPAVPPPPRSTKSFVVVDRSGEAAVFKGLAIAGDKIFATDFHNAKVDVFDSSFNQITGGFADPKLPKGYAPFGIQNLNGNIYVTYAKQDADAHDEIDGHGLGIVDEYSTGGALLARVAQHGELNAPWGLAMAPSDFGKASGDLLVGNFGDGRINVFEPKKNGKFETKSQLKGEKGKDIVIDGLWGLGFGNGSGSGATNALYFAAGPDGEAHGLFGRIEVAPGH
jgi:uncharacterized protein (TIGR03118 family)